jgi:hypothetical protein
MTIDAEINNTQSATSVVGAVETLRTFGSRRVLCIIRTIDLGGGAKQRF